MRFTYRSRGVCPNFKRLFAVLLSCFVGTAGSMEECTQTEYRYTAGGGGGEWSSSQGAACSSYMGWWVGQGSNGENRSGFTASVEGVGGSQCRIDYSQNYCPGAPEPCTGPGSAISEAYNTQEVPCPEDECSENAGQNAFAGMSLPLGPSCLGGCAVNATAAKSVVRCTAGGACSDYTLSQVTYSGTSCDDEPEAQQGNCISGSFGRACINEQGSNNCGTFNGDRVCVEAIESGCQAYASGGMACVVEGPGATENVPDDGEGAPATPQMQVEKDGKVVNYYNSTTVGGSSTTVVTNEAPGGGSGDGSGDGLGEVEQCEGEEDCYGGLPDSFGECAEDLTDCITAAATAAWTGLQENVPLLAFTASIHTSLAASGSCPEAVITVFEETYDVMAPVCSILVDNAGLLSLILQICWSLMGVRILFGGE